jgi:acyl carrier protein
MSLDEIIKVCPGIEKVTLSCYKEFLGDDFDQHKTWYEMGLDDLDIVEMIMKLEKKYGFEFPDNLLDEVFGEDTKPINFIGVVRQRKLNDLGI